MTKILLISTGFGLFLPHSGGRNRFYNLTKQLIQHGFKVAILQPIKYMAQKDNLIGNVTYFKQFTFSSRDLTLFTDLNPHFINNLIKNIIGFRPQIIQISNPFGVIITRILKKLLSFQFQIVYDAHNLESDVYSYGAKSLFEKFFVSYYSLWIENLAIKCSTHIITVSELDKQRFISKYYVDQKKISVIASGVEIKPMKMPIKRNTEKFKIIFHGSYFHPPNREAMDLIQNYISPKIMKYEKIQFILAGDAVPVFKINNLISIGYVNGLEEFLNSADLAIVPIISGGGTRLKILDYMSAGLPILSTKKAVEGIDIVNGEHGIVVDGVNDSFINAIITLFSSKNLRQSLGKNARELAKKNYDWSIIGLKLRDLYRSFSKV